MKSINHTKQSKPPGMTRTEVAVLVAIISILIALLLTPVKQSSGHDHYAMECRSKLKQIALALDNYKDVFGVMPPAYTVDGEGKPLHSWRILILPYLDQVKLYRQIDLTKPWDDSVNVAPAKQTPYCYMCPKASRPTNRTTYLAVVGEKACFAGSRPRKLAEITDKHEETLMLIEVRDDQGVPWMAPMDADEKVVLDFDANTKWPHYKERARFAAFVDGNVKILSNKTTTTELRRMLTIAGGD